MNDVTVFITRVAVIVTCLFITSFVVPYFKTLKDSKEIELISNTVNMAVQAAEQTITGTGQGQIKKTEVVNIVNEWLKTAGISISSELLDVIIEDAVYAMKHA
mgnify:CR=1 FL=1